MTTGTASALKTTVCPICETDRYDREVYAASFDPGALDEQVFSARRSPDRIHYRMVRCQGCGLLRSNPILEPGSLEKLYRKSHFTYEDVATFTRETYVRILRGQLGLAPSKKRLIEVGCGNGFFLEAALGLGFQDVAGVEPSEEAILKASEAVRARIVPGLYAKESFPKEHASVVCAFQVFDHVPDQAALLEAVREHLEPKGLAVFVNHDAGALSARVLGERSPIIDVEHTALFDKATMRKIFEKHGFLVESVFTVRNTYPVGYWARLAPLPRSFRAAALGLLGATGLGRVPLSLRAGNLGLVAIKA